MTPSNVAAEILPLETADLLKNPPFAPKQQAVYQNTQPSAATFERIRLYGYTTEELITYYSPVEIAAKYPELSLTDEEIRAACNRRHNAIPHKLSIRGQAAKEPGVRRRHIKIRLVRLLVWLDEEEVRNVRY